MTLDQLIPLLILVSMSGILLSAALQVGFRDLVSLAHRPSLLLRSLLAMNFMMPLLALTIGLAFELERTLKLTLIAMALAPVPPILPGTQLRAGGRPAYAMGLGVFSCCIAIVFVPLAAVFLGWLFDRPLEVAPAAVARVVVIWMVLPMLLGAALRGWAPRAADALARPVAWGAAVLLLLAILPVLVKEWPFMLELVGNFTIVAIAGFVLAGLAIGHLLGGPDPHERTVLALSAAMRHPGVAMLLLKDAQEERQVVLAALLLMLIVGALTTQPYVLWRSRAEAGAEGLAHGDRRA